MNRNEIEYRFSQIEDLLLKLAEEKPSMLRNIWKRCKPHIIPFIIGMIVGGIIGYCLIPNHLPIEQQAVQGGTVIPFFQISTQQSELTLPSRLNLPQADSKTEIAGIPLMNSSELPLPHNPQVYAGQANSARSSRPLIRRTP